MHTVSFCALGDLKTIFCIYTQSFILQTCYHISDYCIATIQMSQAACFVSKVFIQKPFKLCHNYPKHLFFIIHFSILFVLINCISFFMSFIFCTHLIIIYRLPKPSCIKHYVGAPSEMKLSDIRVFRKD